MIKSKSVILYQSRSREIHRITAAKCKQKQNKKQDQKLTSSNTKIGRIYNNLNEIIQINLNEIRNIICTDINISYNQVVAQSIYIMQFRPYYYCKGFRGFLSSGSRVEQPQNKGGSFSPLTSSLQPTPLYPEDTPAHCSPS